MPRKRPSPEPLQFHPLANGIDYLHQVVSLLTKKRTAPSDLKYAILHMYASIEVCLKARLAQEHWTLVVSNLDKMSEERYKQGDFVSVSTDQTFKRLQSICGLPLSKRDWDTIDAVGKLRNQIQHFGIDVTAEQAIATVANAFSFLWDFINAHIEDSEYQMNLQRVRDDLAKIEGLVQARMATLAPTLDAADVVVECQYCRNAALILSPNGNIECKFCVDRFDDVGREELATQYVHAFLNLDKYTIRKDGGSWPVYTCIECGEDALVEGVTVRNHADLGWVCFSCCIHRSPEAVAHCDLCGQMFSANMDGNAICPTCFRSRVMQAE